MLSCRQDGSVRVIGFKCAKDSFSWAVVEGDTRSSASVVERKVVTAPRDKREVQLAWVSREVRFLLDRFHPDQAVIQAPGGAKGGLTDSLAQRIEVDGVVRCVLGTNAIPTQAIKPQSLPKEFSVKSVELEALIGGIPCVVAIPKTHRDPVVLAVSQLPV
jgi:hypothetical protein